MAVPFIFHEVLLDPLIFERTAEGSPLSGWPTFSNTVIKNEVTRVHKTNVNSLDAVEILNVDLSLASNTKLPYFLSFWRGGYGSGAGFRCRVPWDYTAQNQALGTITASQTKTLYLQKTYTRLGVTTMQDVRRICKPVVNANLAAGCPTLYEADGTTLRAQAMPFAVKVGGATTGFTYTIDNRTGVLVVTTTSASGTVTCDYTFDIPAAFMGNALSNQYDVSSKVSQVQIREILPAELGITV
jgi:hypothetical protein